MKLLRTGIFPASAAGETRNVSSRGVLFHSDVKVEIGEPVEYLITLPPGPGDVAKVNLHCLGKIVRYDGGFRPSNGGSQPVTIVASIERYEFVRDGC